MVARRRKVLEEPRADASSAKPPESVLPGEPRQVDRASVARRAYELYEQRGGGHGRDWDDWFQAERDLRRAAQPPQRRKPVR
jgi:DUF2934 family protein